jgi:DNA-binding transcriptional ArsR family regulator
VDVAPDVARLAGLLADPARARMVWTLIDGTLRPAGELAFAANVSAPSASAHLAKLVAGGLLRCESQGRHRYFRIASREVAQLVEAIASLTAATRPRKPPTAALAREMPPHFLQARTCYDHLAGKRAVEVFAAMVRQRWIVAEGEMGDYRLTTRGREALAGLGVAIPEPSRRAFARSCVDLTERRPHLGGALGAALLELYVRDGWIQRRRGSRVVSVTPRGARRFELMGPDSN